MPNLGGYYRVEGYRTADAAPMHEAYFEHREDAMEWAQQREDVGYTVTVTRDGVDVSACCHGRDITICPVCSDDSDRNYPPVTTPELPR